MTNQNNIEINNKEDFKVLNNKYIKENWNDFELSIITAVNDWHATMFENIVSNFEKVNPNICVNDKGTTLLHWIAGKKDVGFSRKNFLQILIEAGANPLIKDNDGMLASDIAKNKKYSTNFDLLIKAQTEYLAFLERRQKNSVFKYFKVSGQTLEIDLTGLDMYQSKLKVHQEKRKNNWTPK